MLGSLATRADAQTEAPRPAEGKKETRGVSVAGVTHAQTKKWKFISVKVGQNDSYRELRDDWYSNGICHMADKLTQ